MLVAALVTNTDTERRRAEVSSRWWVRQREGWSGTDPGLAGARLAEAVQRVKRTVVLCGESWRLPTILGRAYINYSEEKRTQLGLIALTAGVFLVWNLPPCRRFASTYLWHDALSGRTLTLLTSVFAHKVHPVLLAISLPPSLTPLLQSLPHFAFNSIALFSIGSACSSYLDGHDNLLPRSTSRYEYLALFVSGEPAVFVLPFSRLTRTGP
jgi:rhomboid-like protein